MSYRYHGPVTADAIVKYTPSDMHSELFKFIGDKHKTLIVDFHGNIELGGSFKTVGVTINIDSFMDKN